MIGLLTGVAFVVILCVVFPAFRSCVFSVIAGAVLLTVVAFAADSEKLPEIILLGFKIILIVGFVLLVALSFFLFRREPDTPGDVADEKETRAWWQEWKRERAMAQEAAEKDAWERERWAELRRERDALKKRKEGRKGGE